MALLRPQIGLSRDERLPFLLLLAVFFFLCIAGGASRDDVLAQSVIRGAAVIAMIVQMVAGKLPDLDRYRACVWLLGGMIVIAALQLVPLPPAIWTALPGRGLIAGSPLGDDGWRPLNLVPDAGWNSLFSLLVPLCVLVLLSSLQARTVRLTRYILIGAVIVSALIALLQAAGSAPDNPLINGSTTEYGGIFANRNHQALFLAVGIGVVWFWGFERGGSFRDWRLWLAGSIILLLAISILVTGSRTGLVLGMVAIAAAPPLALVGGSRRRPHVGRAGLAIAVSLAVVICVIGLAVYFGRAQSLTRASSANIDSDFRLRALPTVWEVAKIYFPFGAGLGTFDNVYRIAEPFTLLEPTYFNHAHNDLIETMVETGIFGPTILLCALIWLVRRAYFSLRGRGGDFRLGRLGVLVTALVVLASLSDYPARTPMIMATVMLAACWLTNPDARGDLANNGASALPTAADSL